MKKSRAAVAMVLSAVILAGCTGDNAGSRGEYDGSKDEKPTEAATEPEVTQAPTPTEIPVETPTPTQGTGKIRMSGYALTEDEMMRRLDGVWDIKENFNLIEAPDSLNDTLSFDYSSRTAVYHMAYAAEEAYFDVSFDHDFDEAENMQNAVVLTCTGFSSGFPDEGLGSDAFSAEFYVVISDYCMFMKEMGNGLSAFTQYSLDYDRCNEDYWWVLYRDYDDEPEYEPAVFDRETEIKKDSHFYAFRFEDFGSEYQLMEVEAETFDDISLYGMPATAVAIRYSDNGHPFSMIPYKLYGKEQEAHSGFYSPALVEILTDKNGEVIFCEELPYYGLGYFSPAPASGAPTVPRDELMYGGHDSIFLGEWEALDGSTITITAADPQVGGYHAEISIYRLCQADAYLNMDGADLSINQGYINDEHELKGRLEGIRGGIRFTVTDTEFSLLEVGTVIDFYKK